MLVIADYIIWTQPLRTKKNPVRLSKPRQTIQAAFAASSFSSWFAIKKVSTSKLRPPNRDGYITSQEMVRRSRHLTRDQVHKVSLLVEISDIDFVKI